MHVSLLQNVFNRTVLMKSTKRQLNQNELLKENTRN